VPEHAELSWILSTVAPYGELSRMTQFKEKSEREPDNINAGLFTYPVLMAADILLYRATRVPVGQDQIQHLELAREICRRFNGRFGEIFPEPQPLHAKALKILGLDGKQKMSKSLGNSVLVSDEPDEIRKKIKNAFTDPTHRRFPTEHTFDYWIPGTVLFDEHNPAYGGVAFAKVSMLVNSNIQVTLRKLGL